MTIYVYSVSSGGRSIGSTSGEGIKRDYPVEPYEIKIAD